MCNTDNTTILDLSKYHSLKSVTIGGYCFEYVATVSITGLNELESVVIGMNSFTKYKDDYSIT